MRSVCHSCFLDGGEEALVGVVAARSDGVHRSCREVGGERNKYKNVTRPRMNTKQWSVVTVKLQWNDGIIFDGFGAERVNGGRDRGNGFTEFGA